MAAIDFSDGAMVALYPRENEARALAADGGQPPESLHVTLLYLGTAREALPLIELTQAVAGGVASKTEALAGTVGGVATFEDNGDGAPVVLLPDVPGLTELGTALRDELARVGVESPSEHGFQPHLTISYGGDAEALADRIGEPLHFDTLCVVVGSDRFEYALQSPPQAMLAADHPQAPLPSEAAMGLLETEAEIRDLALRAQGLEGREAVLAALTAAGVEDSVEPTTTYELARENSLAERRFYAEALAAGYSETRRAAWPSEADLGDHGEVLHRDEDGGVFRLPNGVIAYVRINHGWLNARIASPTRSEGSAAVGAFAQSYPPMYAEETDGLVPITFWTNSQWGPVSRLRKIEASPWEAIEQNYAEAVHDEVGRLVGDFEPGKDGQLLLWQGPPGTGKTWALRALASEWSEWAEFHYITDPDAFFVSNPSYMIDVLLHETYEEFTTDEEVLTTVPSDGKWRVLILEDTGELLSANAKEAYGQGLSRLLNVVDGMVGQGLKVLALVTTNDELGDLHPAAVRPGRCASQIVFAPLSAAEASEWLGETVDEGGTLAELYARRGGSERAFEEDEPEVRLAAASSRASDEALAAAAVQIEQPTNASQLRWSGVLMIEGAPTDDGRMIDPGAIDWRDLPLSLMAMTETGVGGHQGAFLAGRIDEIWRDGNRIMGAGVFDNSDDGREVARLVDERMLRGVSVDLAIRSYELRPKDDSLEQADEGDLIDALLGDEVEMVYVVTDGSIGMATVCPFPAFADAEIALVASAPLTWRATTQNAMTITEGETTEPDSPAQEEAPAVVTASAAGLAPVVPPAEWFENPNLEEPTPLQVSEEGRVFGHAAVWDTCHIGFENACVLAPRSPSGYRYFHLGEVVLDLDGERLSIPCGQITLGTGHANLRLSRADAVDHYDNSGTAAVDVVAGEDEYGIWFAGAIRPDIDEERARELRGAKISGDWRNVAGELELVAMLAVNVPGFPVPRVRVASALPEPMGEALVAAGVADRRVLDAMRDRAETDDEELTSMLSRSEVPLSKRDEPASRNTLAEAALATLATAHSRTVEAVEQVLADGGNGEQAERELAVARQALDVLETFAAREQPRPGDIHVHVPEREVNVAAPNVTVEAAAPAEVHVDSPQIDVHVPEQPAPQVLVAAPEVRVEVEAPKPRAVRVEEDEDGNRRYIPESE